MTEASKARKRHPMRVLTVPPGTDLDSPITIAELHRALFQAAGVFAMSEKVVFTSMVGRPRTPIRVTTTGVRAVTGVGNRRRRARQRRAERRAEERARSRGAWTATLTQEEAYALTIGGKKMLRMVREGAAGIPHPAGTLAEKGVWAPLLPEGAWKGPATSRAMR